MASMSAHLHNPKFKVGFKVEPDSNFAKMFVKDEETGESIVLTLSKENLKSIGRLAARANEVLEK